MMSADQRQRALHRGESLVRVHAAPVLAQQLARQRQLRAPVAGLAGLGEMPLEIVLRLV